jgi:sulfatase maturation enzyme AslB (radical SAM superfamily)
MQHSSFKLYQWSKLLQWIDRRNLHSRLNLHITSNFTKVDNSWLEIFEKFNRIHISASIDSTNANFNYVRWPANFNKVEQ